MMIPDSEQFYGYQFDPLILRKDTELKFSAEVFCELYRYNKGGTSLEAAVVLCSVYLLVGLLLSSRNQRSNASSDAIDGSSSDHAVTASRRVLIIDDDVTMREAIGYMLEELGIEFDAVDSGEEGLAKIKRRSYDLVLLDLVLHTGANGIEILRRLGKRSEHPKPQVVLMTASASGELIFRQAVKSRLPILRKPFSLDDLEHIIGQGKTKPTKS